MSLQHERLLSLLSSTNSSFRIEDISRGLVLSAPQIASVCTVLGQEIFRAVTSSCSRFDEEDAQSKAICSPSAATRGPLTPHCRVIPGKLVGLVIREGLLLALAEITIACMGFTFVPFSLSDPPHRRKQLLEVLKPDCLVSEELVDKCLRVVLEGDIAVGSCGNNGCSRGVQLSESSPWPCCCSLLAQRRASDDDPLWVIFTSGSTGTPKAVVASWGNLAAYVDSFVALSFQSGGTSSVRVVDHQKVKGGESFSGCGMGVTSASRQLLLSSATFDPSIGDIFSSLLLQSTLVTASREEIEGALCSVLIRARATHVVTTPALWGTMTAADTVRYFTACRQSVHQDEDEEDEEQGKREVQNDTQYDSSRRKPCRLLNVFLGGEKTPKSLVRQWTTDVASLLQLCASGAEICGDQADIVSVVLYNIYGVTEATIYQSACWLGTSATAVEGLQRGGGADDHRDCIYPLTGATEMFLDCSMDRGDSDAVVSTPATSSHGAGGACVVGELLLRGPQVCLGYYNELSGLQDRNLRQRKFFKLLDDREERGKRLSRAATRVYRTGDIATAAVAHNEPSALNTACCLTDEQELLHLLAVSPAAKTPLRLCGRVDFQVKVNGIRLSLEGVEASLQDTLAPIAGFTRAICAQWCSVDLQDETAADAPTAYHHQRTEILCWINVEEHLGSAETNNSSGSPRLAGKRGRWNRVMRRLALQILPPHAAPLHFFAVSDIPCQLTPTGKLDRVAITAAMKAQRQQLLKESTSGTGIGHQDREGIISSPSAANPVEEALLAACAYEFGVPVTPDMDFFRVGGDSLTALKVLRQVFLRLHAQGLLSGSRVEGASINPDNAMRSQNAEDPRRRIDNYGTMPEPFLPRYFAEFPVIRDLAVFVSDRLSRGSLEPEDKSRPGAGSGPGPGPEPGPGGRVGLDLAPGLSLNLKSRAPRESRNDSSLDIVDDSYPSLKKTRMEGGGGSPAQDSDGEGGELPQESEHDRHIGIGNSSHDGSIHRGGDSGNTAAVCDEADAVLLMECVAAGDVFLARALLKLQVSQVNGVSARSSPKLSPLHCAVVNNQMECVRLLVEEFGAKLTIFDMEGVSPGHAAARIPGCVMLKYFLENGYPPTSRDHRGQTLLHVAARYGNSECVDFILFRLNCIAFDVRDCWQRTAVHWAIVNNHRNVLTVMQRYLEDVQQGRPPPSCAPGSANRVLPARQIGRKERFVRLAAKRSHLIYETPMELCRRLYPANDPIFSICESFTHML